jgi:hypothetical protein
MMCVLQQLFESVRVREPGQAVQDERSHGSSPHVSGKLHPFRCCAAAQPRNSRAWSAPRELEKQNLHEFEVAQLGNLCPEDADEAKALVPSLALPNIDGQPRDIDSASLTEVLQQICDSRQFD